MKRAIFITGLSLVLALALTAQTLPGIDGQSSLESSVTQGLFLNDIDSSFAWGFDFGAATAPFIFAGVSGNPLSATNSGSPTKFAGGFYQPGSLPFSVYTSMTAAGLTTPNSNAATTQTFVNKNVIAGSTTTNYKYVGTESASKYTMPSALDNLDLSFQGTIKLGNLATGLYFNQTGDWSAINGDSAFYAEVTKKTNYDSAAAGSAPVAALDYTTTTKAKNINVAALPAFNTAAPVAIGTAGLNTTTSTTTLEIPFVLAAAKAKLSGYAKLVLDNSDGSGSYTSSETAHVNTTIATITDRDTAITAQTNATTIGGLFVATLPGLFLADKGGEFTAGLKIDDTITAQQYSYSDKASTYDGSVLNAKTAKAGGNLATATATYTAANNLVLTGFAAHSIPLSAGDTVKLILKPSAIFGFTANGNSGGGGILKSSVRYTQALDANFNYDSGTYTKISTTVTGNPASQYKIDTTLGLPTAAEIKPTGWAFGFYMGASPSANFVWTTTKTAAQVTNLVTETITAGAATATTNTTTNTSSSSSTALVTTLGETHSLGIFIPFDGKIRLDIDLNGSNLLVFDNLTFQLYVPLK